MLLLLLLLLLLRPRSSPQPDSCRQPSSSVHGLRVAHTTALSIQAQAHGPATSGSRSYCAGQAGARRGVPVRWVTVPAQGQPKGME
jgi:hypothetical protein